MDKMKLIAVQGVQHTSSYLSGNSCKNLRTVRRSLSHLPHSPDFAINNYHLVRLLKVAESGIHFYTDNEVQCVVQNWLQA
jgi:hypothetical protein